jgi:UDP-glucose 4-epimerase
MSRILITGSQGFIAGYIINLLLKEGHKVIGIDNYSKYGKIPRSYDNNKNFKLIIEDAKNIKLLKKILINCDYFIANAAMIGGTYYFHKYPYDLYAENERLTLAAIDASIYAYNNSFFKKILLLSSSAIYSNLLNFPSKEGDEWNIAPPNFGYGFQKLAIHSIAQSAFEQYKLPYALCVIFNCIGIGEKKTLLNTEINNNGQKFNLSHVIPDIIYKILINQKPLLLLGDGKQTRSFTHGIDVARAIYSIMLDDVNINQSFNISSEENYSIIEIAKKVWKKIKKDEDFYVEFIDALKYDVKIREPDTSKIKNIYSFKQKISIDEALDEIILYVEKLIKKKEI